MDPHLAPSSRFVNGEVPPPGEVSSERLDLFQRDFVDSCRGLCDHNATETEGTPNTARRIHRLLRRFP